MIKVKNLENIEDQDSISYDQLNAFIPQFSPCIQNFQPFSISYNSPANASEFSQFFTNTQQSQISPKPLYRTPKPFQTSPQLSDLEQSQRRQRRYRQSATQLKQLISDQKTKILIRNFVNKLSRNNVNSLAVEVTPFSTSETGFADSQGIHLTEPVLIIMNLLNVLQIAILTFIYTLAIVFQQVGQNSEVEIFQSFCLGFYIIEIFLNFATIKMDDGRKLQTLREIWKYYLNHNFLIDFISIIILTIDIETNYQIINYIRLFIIVKLPQGLEKIEKLELFLINNFYNEQYWSLIKVLIFNYCFAHILAIFLIAMANIDDTQNWMITKQITDSPWYQKYAWSYYWATTTMLTVGFGDLSATTYKQAIVLIFIETISCMALAYNINCIGTLITNIRSQDLQKSKNFKIFRKLAKKNHIPSDLSWRINNYIEESINIKKNFNYEEENVFVQKLPKGLKTQFLKESNKKIFQNLPFFKNLMEKTLFSFAQKIEMHICHPQEIVQHIDDRHNLLILKGGSIGFTCKKQGCDYNGRIVDTLKVSQNSQPKLISLGFIRQDRSIYEIKSLEYSILYFLDIESIISILKSSEMDYQLYCLLRDKSSHMPDQYELFKCQVCSDRHTKFICPKLHFIPIKQHTVNKYIHKYKTGKMFRKLTKRYQTQKYNALKIYLDINIQQQRKQQVLKQKKSTQKTTINVLNQRKKFQPIIEQPNNLLKQISDIKDFFSRNAAQVIKHQMAKVLLHGQGSDQVWVIEADRMKNYKGYFEADNSCNLSDKFKLQKRNRTGVFWHEGGPLKDRTLTAYYNRVSFKKVD